MEGRKTIIELKATSDTIATTVRIADRSINKKGVRTAIVIAKIIAIMRHRTNRDSKYYAKVK
jgi:hypothetical protein